MPRGHYIRKIYKPLFERLMKKTVKNPQTECWEWTGSAGMMGHGQIKKSGTGPDKMKRLMTHRVSWGHFNGPIPGEMCVLHKCDNPRCINPDHLFLGTKSDNTQDMIKKGRMKVGTDLPHAKLTPEDVRAIRASNDIQEIIAKRFGITGGQVSMIKSRKHWAHVL